ncbi:MAG: DUF2254 domain-containing protein [Chitinophagaceae bacterium]
MTGTIQKFIRKNYNRLVTSIAFMPAIIAISFLLFSWLMIELDFSTIGKNIKTNHGWIRLKDASTARSILSAIVSGIISLTVFSFSMVMILLNQAASQMSNRMLEGMIGNRFQQFVLGFYIGTIVYALFLLSTIRDIDSGIYVPALSIYLLLILTVADIFLFIYFLHYVTQSVKFETIINRIHKQTIRSLDRKREAVKRVAPAPGAGNTYLITMTSSDYFQDFDEKGLLTCAVQHDGLVKFLHPTGTFLLKGAPLMIFYCTRKVTDDTLRTLLLKVDFYSGQPIDKNPVYGYHQLAEVAIKALSPGINDPETAVLSLHALTDLFYYLLKNSLKSDYFDDRGHIRIQTTNWSFEKLFEECYYPIWDYGKKDRYIQQALLSMTSQLQQSDTNKSQAATFANFSSMVKKEVDKLANGQ